MNATMARKPPQPQRAEDQTMVSCSMSKALYAALEEGRATLQMDRSNFIRYCIAKELKSLGVDVKKGKES